MAGSTERNLVWTDEDPNSLYGVYQCLVGQEDPYQQSVGNPGRNVFTIVARVMPYGMLDNNQREGNGGEGKGGKGREGEGKGRGREERK